MATDSPQVAAEGIPERSIAIGQTHNGNLSSEGDNEIAGCYTDRYVLSGPLPEPSHPGGVADIETITVNARPFSFGRVLTSELDREDDTLSSGEYLERYSFAGRGG